MSTFSSFYNWESGVFGIFFKIRAEHCTDFKKKIPVSMAPDIIGAIDTIYFR